jgi:multiple sugar transport system substrate-binding protein
MTNRNSPILAPLVISIALGFAANAAQAQEKTITLCWAAWDPANALVELSKDFTAASKVKM